MDTEQLARLRAYVGAESLSRIFPDRALFRQIDDEDFGTDITINVSWGNNNVKTFHAHSSVLCSGSPILKQMLELDPQNKVISIDATEHWSTFDAVLKTIYEFPWAIDSSARKQPSLCPDATWAAAVYKEARQYEVIGLQATAEERYRRFVESYFTPHGRAQRRYLDDFVRSLWHVDFVAVSSLAEWIAELILARSELLLSDLFQKLMTDVPGLGALVINNIDLEPAQ